ncbi:MAG: exodeoxyribonuclease VII small subunit [Treponema sp.]|nr:exodeoxyribonuclease VII small subunit [Treponema sp.]
MTNFEEKLERLEALTTQIKQSDITLEDALKNFEEGIKLAKSMEKEIEKIEGKIQILMNDPLPQPDVPHTTTEMPELDLFTGADEATGSSGAPQQGTRQ